MGCGRPQCEVSCNPTRDGMTIPVGEKQRYVDNQRFFYNPLLGHLEERRCSYDDAPINLREKEELIHKATMQNALYAKTANELRKEGVSEDYLKALDSKKKLYDELKALDARTDLTPEERDIEERRLLALKHNL
jgi:hypothetical protein